MTALQQTTAAFRPTVEALHALAEQVISPARRRASGHGFLVQLPGGFGAPEGAPRVEGVDLVAVGEAREAISSLARAAKVLGLPGDGLDDSPLAIDPASASVLAEFFLFARFVLETLRGEATAAQDPSTITLWPEHFDLAFEFGAEAQGRRAGYGASPGDAEHAGPYLYVGPWQAPAPGALWQANGFNGAELRYADLGAEPQEAALEFFRSRRDALLSAERQAPPADPG